jgi:hypothetical protein
LDSCRPAVAAFAIAIFCIASREAISKPSKGVNQQATATLAGNQSLTVVGGWPYTQSCDGAFAAFVGRQRIVVESRWLGPSFQVLGGDSPLANTPGPLRLAIPRGVPAAYGPSAAISEGGGLLAAEARRSGGHWRVWVWNPSSSRSAPIAVAGLPTTPTLSTLSFSPNGRLLAFLGTRRANHPLGVVLCSTANGKFRQMLHLPKAAQSLVSRGRVVMVSFASTGQVDCVVGSSPETRVLGWKIPSGRPLPMAPRLKTADGIWCATEDRKARELLLSGTAPQREFPNLLIVDSLNGGLISRVALGGPGRALAEVRFAHSVTASGVAASPDGRYAVVVGFGELQRRRHGNKIAGWLVVVSLRTRKVVFATSRIPACVPWHVAVSPGGRRILIASQTKFYLLRAPFPL